MKRFLFTRRIFTYSILEIVMILTSGFVLNMAGVLAYIYHVVILIFLINIEVRWERSIAATEPVEGQS